MLVRHVAYTDDADSTNGYVMSYKYVCIYSHTYMYMIYICIYLYIYHIHVIHILRMDTSCHVNFHVYISTYKYLHRRLRETINLCRTSSICVTCLTSKVAVRV